MIISISIACLRLTSGTCDECFHTIFHLSAVLGLPEKLNSAQLHMVTWEPGLNVTDYCLEVIRIICHSNVFYCANCNLTSCFHFFNIQIIAQMWPFVGKMVRQILKEKVEPAMQKKLPAIVKSLYFEKISLGNLVRFVLMTPLYRRLCKIHSFCKSIPFVRTAF